MSAIKNDDVSLGRFISLVLRHEPSAAGIELDSEGWADVDDLIRGVCDTGRILDMETLERIVRENNKKRYSFNEDKTKIRANQGHSIDVHIDMKIMSPPDVLYHGTSVTAPFICHPEVNVSCHAGNRSVKVQTLYFVKMTTLFVRAECS